MNNQRAPPLNAQIDRAVRSTVYALKMPIVAHQGWESAVPDDLKEGMSLYRMAQLMRNPEGFLERASDEEALAYLSTASLAAPMGYEWARIYMNLCRGYMVRWRKKGPEELPDFLQEEIPLRHHEVSLLNALKRWIRRKQLQHMKAQEREDRAAGSRPPSEHEPSQLSLDYFSENTKEVKG